MSFKSLRGGAEQAARSLLQRMGVGSFPVPVEGIAKRLGVVVQVVPLDDHLSGMAFVKEGHSVIVVNASHHPNRQRFTLAHELAHHVLHKEYLAENVHVDTAVLTRNERSSAGIDSKEVQANAFAAELLMPQAQLRRLGKVDVNDEVRMADLARRFKVSTSAMAVRLENLQRASSVASI
jgi:Zn-dependent peptidase ImmA (M78 family)